MPEIRSAGPEYYDPRALDAAYREHFQNREFAHQDRLQAYHQQMLEREREHHDVEMQQRLNQQERFWASEHEANRQQQSDLVQQRGQGAMDRIQYKMDAAGQAKHSQIQDARNKATVEMGQMLDRDPNMQNPATKARMQYYQRFSDMLDAEEAGIPHAPPMEPPDPQDLDAEAGKNLMHYQRMPDGTRQLVPGGLGADESGTVYVRTVRNGNASWTPHEVKATANLEQQKHDQEMMKMQTEQLHAQQTSQRELDHQRRQGEQKLYMDRITGAEKFRQQLFDQNDAISKANAAKDPGEKPTPTMAPADIDAKVQERFGDLNAQKPQWWDNPGGATGGQQAPPPQQQINPGVIRNNAVVVPNPQQGGPPPQMQMAPQMAPPPTGAQTMGGQPPMQGGPPAMDNPLMDASPNAQNGDSAPDWYTQLKPGDAYVDPRDGKKKRKK